MEGCACVHAVPGSSWPLCADFSDHVACHSACVRDVPRLSWTRCADGAVAWGRPYGSLRRRRRPCVVLPVRNVAPAFPLGVFSSGALASALRIASPTLPPEGASASALL